MSLKSRITDIARQEAQRIVRNETSLRDTKGNSCNLMGTVTKAEVKDGQIIITILLADGTTITANGAGIGKPLGPGVNVLVVNGIIVL